MIVESYEDVISLSGALRSNFWETVHTAISLTLKRHPTGVIIDCSGLTEMTPEGAQTFRDVMEYLHNHDARVIVAAVPPALVSVLRSVPEVRSQLPIADSVEEARHSLDLVTEATPAKRRGPSGGTGGKTVVYLTGEAQDIEAVRLAAQICEERNMELHLLYIVPVPRDLPLNAPLAREEDAAAAAIDRSKALLEKGARYTPHVERGRDIASALEEFMEEAHASLVVIPLSCSPADAERNGRAVRTAVAKLKEEIIFVLRMRKG